MCGNICLLEIFTLTYLIFYFMLICNAAVFYLYINILIVINNNIKEI